MVACSIGEVMVLTGVSWFGVDGVNCDFIALSLDCSMGARPL
jgi:hypothetical protein